MGPRIIASMFVELKRTCLIEDAKAHHGLLSQAQSFSQMIKQDENYAILTFVPQTRLQHLWEKNSTILANVLMTFKYLSFNLCHCSASLHSLFYGLHLPCNLLFKA